MLVRLLLAVLTMAGPVPTRVCTCAAAARTAPAVVPPAADVGTPARTCGCRHHPAEATFSAAPAPVSNTNQCATQTGHPDQHDRDCPAANPLPAAPVVALTVGFDAAADFSDVSPVLLDKPARETPTATRRAESRRSPLPLFLSLLTLRI